MKTDAFKIDRLLVKRYSTRAEMGEDAANEAIERIRQLLGTQEEVNVVFAAAPSQNEFLETLAQATTVDWSRINAFHMDEYVGLDEKDPQRFGSFLYERIFSRVPFRKVHYLDGNHPDIKEECLRYAQLLRQHPADMVCMGIGENAHIAFNDPHVANFNDPDLVKVVDLDQECRQQQVNDKCFAAIEEVPRFALTLTVPALMAARFAFCMVPGPTKALAVRNTLVQEIEEIYPSTILRTHPNAVLYVDSDSFALCDNGIQGNMVSTG